MRAASTAHTRHGGITARGGAEPRERARVAAHPRGEAKSDQSGKSGAAAGRSRTSGVRPVAVEPRLATIEPQPIDPSLRNDMLDAVPRLRGFAISLCGNIDHADDLVQETMLRALSHIHQFEPGTNMLAWLFTILRNLFRTEYRKRRREVEDDDGSYAESMKSQAEQTGRLEFVELRTALAELPADQREAIILVGAAGLSYDEAAEICRCPIGTIKSRVSRARGRLAELLSIETVEDLGPDCTTRAVLVGSG